MIVAFVPRAASETKLNNVNETNEFQLRFHARNREEILALNWTIYAIISYRHLRRNSGDFKGDSRIRTHDLCEVMHRLSFNNDTFQRKQKSADSATNVFHSYLCRKD